MHCTLRGDAKYKEDIVSTGYTGAAQTKEITQRTSTLLVNVSLHLCNHCSADDRFSWMCMFTVDRFFV